MVVLRLLKKEVWQARHEMSCQAKSGLSPNFGPRALCQRTSDRFLSKASWRSVPAFVTWDQDTDLDLDNLNLIRMAVRGPGGQGSKLKRVSGGYLISLSRHPATVTCREHFQLLLSRYQSY